jgi:hypothetical protein
MLRLLAFIPIYHPGQVPCVILNFSLINFRTNLSVFMTDLASSLVADTPG